MQAATLMVYTNFYTFTTAVLKSLVWPTYEENRLSTHFNNLEEEPLWCKKNSSNRKCCQRAVLLEEYNILDIRLVFENATLQPFMHSWVFKLCVERTITTTTREQLSSMNTTWGYQHHYTKKKWMLWHNPHHLSLQIHLCCNGAVPHFKNEISCSTHLNHHLHFLHLKPGTWSLALVIYFVSKLVSNIFKSLLTHF
jgi:hypothetical protein